MGPIRDIVHKNSTGTKTLFLFLLASAVYVFMLTITIPNVMCHAPGMNLLDMMPMGYGPEDVRHLFEALGPEGRNAYFWEQLPIDMVYPLLFGVSNALVLAYVLKKLDKFERPLFYLCLIPLLAGLADYLENIGILVMLNDYPILSTGIVTKTSVFSLAKSSLTTIHFLGLLMVLGALGLKILRKKFN